MCAAPFLDMLGASLSFLVDTEQKLAKGADGTASKNSGCHLQAGQDRNLLLHACPKQLFMCLLRTHWQADKVLALS